MSKHNVPRRVLRKKYLKVNPCLFNLVTVCPNSTLHKIAFLFTIFTNDNGLNIWPASLRDRLNVYLLYRTQYDMKQILLHIESNALARLLTFRFAQE